MCHKWQSYDVWFLKYGVQWTEFFIIMDHFLPFYPLTTRKIKILKKWKRTLEILFYKCEPRIIICYTVPEIWHVTDVVFIFSFWLFFYSLPPTLTPNDLKNKISKKWKRTPSIYSFLGFAYFHEKHFQGHLWVVDSGVFTLLF